MLFYLLTVLIILLYALRRWFTFWERQGVKAESIWSGNGFFDQQHRHSLRMLNKHGRVYGGYMLNKYYLVINDPDMIREVYVKNFDVFPNHLHFNLGPSPRVNKMVFFMPGDENWKRVRSVIALAFTSGKLKEMMSQISETTDIFVKRLHEFERKGEVVDMRQYFGAFALDLISSSAYGIKIDSINNPTHPIVHNAKKVLSIDFSFSMITSIVLPKLASLLKLNFFNVEAFNFYAEMIEEIIDNRRKINQQTGNKNADFIQLLMDSEKNELDINGNVDETCNKTASYLSNDEIISQSILFLIAGYDSTTSALSHVVYHLAENKDCQQILYEELKDVKEFSYENLSRLKYLNAVIDETLRLSPPVLRFQRQSVEAFELSGIKIPRDTVVEICPYALHRDPELWTDPLEFKPERFIEPTHPPFAYLPFGAGHRLCLGQRFVLNVMRMCIAKLLTKFEFSLIPGFKPEYFRGNIIHSPKSMKFKLTAR